MKSILLVAAAILSFTPTSVRAENYFCSAEVSAGFRWTEKTDWAATTFNTQGDQFTVVLNEAMAATDYPYEVTRMGEQKPMLFCSDGPNIVCGGLLLGFILNKATLRFHTLYGYGYIDDRPTGNTPALTAGKCSKL